MHICKKNHSHQGIFQTFSHSNVVKNWKSSTNFRRIFNVNFFIFGCSVHFAINFVEKFKPEKVQTLDKIRVTRQIIKNWRKTLEKTTLWLKTWLSFKYQIWSQILWIKTNPLKFQWKFKFEWLTWKLRTSIEHLMRFLYFGYIETKSKPDFVLQIHRNVLVNDWLATIKAQISNKKGWKQQMCSWIMWTI